MSRRLSGRSLDSARQGDLNAGSEVGRGDPDVGRHADQHTVVAVFHGLHHAAENFLDPGERHRPERLIEAQQQFPRLDIPLGFDLDRNRPLQGDNATPVGLRRFQSGIRGGRNGHEQCRAAAGRQRRNGGIPELLVPTMLFLTDIMTQVLGLGAGSFPI